MPLMYIPSSYSESPFGTACHSYQLPPYESYTQPQDTGYDFSYAALVNRQREHELQRQRREEARIQRERQRELRLKQERERLIREMIQQREMQRYRQYHHQRNLERQCQPHQQARHRMHPAFHLAHRDEPVALPIQTRSPTEQFLSSVSGINHRHGLEDDSASTDEDTNEDEYDDSEGEQFEQPERHQSNIFNPTFYQAGSPLAPQSQPKLQPQPQPQPSRSLNQIVELEQTLRSLLRHKLPTLNRVQLEGHLTNLLLEADRVDPHGEPDEDAVRSKRRELVRAVEQVLSRDENMEGDRAPNAEERRIEEEEEQVESELQPLTV